MIFSKQNRRFVVKAINNNACVKASVVVKAIDAVRTALLNTLSPQLRERLSESGGMPGTPSMSWHYCCQHQPSSMHLLYGMYMQITGTRTTVTGTAS